MSNIDDESKNFSKVEKIATTFAAPYYEGDYLGNIFKGWFVAPASTRYRFSMSCDDDCLLIMGKTPDVGPEVFNNTEEIISVKTSSSYRQYKKVDGVNRVSEWRTLEEGKNYYIESHHVESRGGDHFTVAVEIEQTEIVGHHHALREVQYLGIHTNDYRDTVRFTIDNPDGGDFKLVLVDPRTGKMTTSKTITTGDNIWEFRAAIISHYWRYLGSNIDVSTVWYDAAGNETTSKSDAV